MLTTDLRKSSKSTKPPSSPSKMAPGRVARTLTARDLGWTREQAREARAKLSAFSADWDDPSMDVYDEA